MIDWLIILATSTLKFTILKRLKWRNPRQIFAKETNRSVWNFLSAKSLRPTPSELRERCIWSLQQLKDQFPEIHVRFPIFETTSCFKPRPPVSDLVAPKIWAQNSFSALRTVTLKIIIKKTIFLPFRTLGPNSGIFFSKIFKSVYLLLNGESFKNPGQIAKFQIAREIFLEGVESSDFFW